MDDLHVIERSYFCLDAKTLIRTLDKMNYSRPIIKTFLFPYTERTERIFIPILPTVFIFARTRKY